MKIQAFLTVETRNKAGQLVHFEKKEANSFVRAFMDILYDHMSQSAVTNGTTDTSNTNKTTTLNGANFAANAAIGVVTNGIRVGTGTNAVTVADYALQTAIAHGNSSGQLSHAATTFSPPATVGTSRQFTTSRSLTNNSGSNITVNEVAIYIGVNGANYFCMDRTLNTFTINNGSTSTVTYTIKVTV